MKKHLLLLIFTAILSSTTYSASYGVRTSDGTQCNQNEDTGRYFEISTAVDEQGFGSIRLGYRMAFGGKKKGAVDCRGVFNIALRHEEIELKKAQLDFDLLEAELVRLKTAALITSSDMEVKAEKLAPKSFAESISFTSAVVYFAFDKSELNDDSRASLFEISQFLISNPQALRLEGHADDRGTHEYNMALSKRRAHAVKDFMVLQGVSGRMIEVVSYGEERAAAFDSNPKAWGLNRRVELKMTAPPPP